MKYILLFIFVSSSFSQSKYPADTLIVSSKITIIKKIGLLDDLSFSSAYNIAAEEFNWSNLTFSGRTNFFNDKLALTFNGSLDPYALDESGNRINVYKNQTLILKKYYDIMYCIVTIV